MQHLKYIAHVTRRENSSLQKQFLFVRQLRVHQRNGKSFQNLPCWMKASLDVKMFHKSEFKKLLSKTKERLDSESNPMRTIASTDNLDDDDERNYLELSSLFLDRTYVLICYSC